MKVSVDISVCQGHSLCHVNAPDIFDLDEIDGWSIVKLPDGLVPPELEAKVRQAVANCPEQAISFIV